MKYYYVPIVKETEHGWAWIVSCKEVFYSAKSGLSFLWRSFLKAGLYWIFKTAVLLWQTFVLNTWTFNLHVMPQKHLWPPRDDTGQKNYSFFQRIPTQDKIKQNQKHFAAESTDNQSTKFSKKSTVLGWLISHL